MSSLSGVKGLMYLKDEILRSAQNDIKVKRFMTHYTSGTRNLGKSDGVDARFRGHDGRRGYRLL
jgi:hypothetical protein